jgi:hypothetical protein
VTLYRQDTSELRAYLAGVQAFADDIPEIEHDAELQAAQIVVDSARPTVPRVTGAAQGSLRVLDFTDGAAAVGGRPSVPYFGWLSFGGYAGRNHSVYRDRVPEGRYLHPALLRETDKIEIMMGDTVLFAARAAGIA